MQRKQAELEAKKREYKDGYWNVNTVILGGLGKEPEISGTLYKIYAVYIKYLCFNGTCFFGD